MMSQAYRDAYAVGRSHGYDHANYSINVEGRDIEDADVECERLNDDGVRLDSWHLARTEDETSGYGTGYRDGIDAYLSEDAEQDSDDVEGCSCGMADYGAPGHDGHDAEQSQR